MDDGKQLDESGVMAAAARNEEEDRMVFHLTDEDMRLELLDIANATEKALINLYLACVVSTTAAAIRLGVSLFFDAAAGDRSTGASRTW